MSGAAPAEFLELAAEYGIAFDEGDLGRLGRFVTLLLEASGRFNLTAITEPAEVWRRHVFDSLTLLPWIEAAGGREVIDVGSGGGLPALPLAIVAPTVAFTLLEATGKKARFLEETIAALAISNAQVVNERAETAGRDRRRHRERYDLALARAVGRLPVLLELALPLVRVGGRLLAIKGEQAGAEIEAAEEALARLYGAVVDRRRTPTGTVLVIEKDRRTAKLYPRRPGEPKRAPLGGRL